jgi:hypothetical protein
LTLTPQGCPNPKWTFSGYEVTKANAQAVFVKVPSFTTKDLGQSGPPVVLDSGFAEYLTTGCRQVLVPDLDTNKDGKLDDNDTGLYVIENGSIKMVEVEVCDFLKSPMTYCSRLAGTIGPDGKEADSGLRIHWYDDPQQSQHVGEEVPLGDDTFNVRECQLWRDVNKLSAYDLSNIGGTQYLYNPDTDRTHYVSPQTGSADAGGLALSIAPFVWWTGECHQHGSDGGNDGDANYSWVQVGPDKQHLVNGVLTADWICQGGSQLMDGVYTDGILP